MIQFGQTESHIETIVEKNEIEYQIDMHLKKNSPKGIAINKIPIRKPESYSVLLILYSFARGSEYYQKRSGRATKIHGRGALSAG